MRGSRAIIVWAALVLSGCSLVTTPDPVGDGGSAGHAELFVVHSLAETLSAVTIEEDGSFGAVDSDAQYLGAAANHLIAADEALIATISGENRLLVLDTDSLEVRRRIDFASGSNPMESVYLGEGLVATTNLLSDTVRIDDLRGRRWDGDLPMLLEVGSAPQALLALTDGSIDGSDGTGAGDDGAGGAGGGADTIGLLVANTAFSTERPAERPFGAGTLTHLRLAVDTESEPPSIEVHSRDTISLEASRYDPATEAGLNPTALIDVPEADEGGEILVVGSGTNYGSAPAGADDGEVVVLDRETLAVTARLEVGGSPGSGVVRGGPGGLTLYLAGPGGIRALSRGERGWENDVRVAYEAQADSGALPFLSDIERVGAMIYAADFANNRLLAFEMADDGGLTVKEEVPTSLGPIELHSRSEPP